MLAHMGEQAANERPTRRRPAGDAPVNPGGRRGVPGSRLGDVPAVVPASLGAVAALALALAVGHPASRVGVSRTETSRCAPAAAEVVFPNRPDRDRALLPVGYRSLAPVTALWCRYSPDGALTAALDLDAARTARLAAVLATPVAGWPDDAIAAKTIPALTPEQVAAASAPPCAGPAPGEFVIFTYGQGPDAAVLVRAAPCRDVANGVVRLRASDDVLAALDELAP